MILRQPLPQTRRQQQLLLTLTSNEVLGHTDILLSPPDDTPLRNSHRPECKRSADGVGRSYCPASERAGGPCPS